MTDLPDSSTEAHPQTLFEARLLEELPRLDRFVKAKYGGASGDVVQETLLRAWGARGSFDPRRELWPWLRQIAANAASRRLEAEFRRESALPSEVLDQDLADAA
ncbi:MAG: sigma factor, partial [Planctomycetota bacterium]